MRGRDHAPVKGETFQNSGRAGGADRFRRILRSGIALAGHHAAAADLRQQSGKRLGFGLQGGETVRFGFAKLRIVLQGALIHREEIGCGSGGRRCAGSYAGDYAEGNRGQARH